MSIECFAQFGVRNSIYTFDLLERENRCSLSTVVQNITCTKCNQESYFSHFLPRHYLRSVLTKKISLLILYFQEAHHQNAYHQNYDKVRTEEQQEFVNVSQVRKSRVRFKFRSRTKGNEELRWQLLRKVYRGYVSQPTFRSRLFLAQINAILHNEWHFRLLR